MRRARGKSDQPGFISGAASTIEDKVLSKAEEYKKAEIKGVFFRVYFKPDDIQPPVDLPLLNDDLLNKIIEVYTSKDQDTDPESCTIPEDENVEVSKDASLR